MTDDIVKRLKDACAGHPAAEIPWPHRLLHDAIAEITLLREAARAAPERAVEVREEIIRLRPHYQSQTATDAGRRQILDHFEAMLTAAPSALVPDPAAGEVVADFADYDAGLLNDFGGGNVDWWWDYLRAEIGRANEFWRTQVAAPAREALAPSREEALVTDPTESQPGAGSPPGTGSSPPRTSE